MWQQDGGADIAGAWLRGLPVVNEGDIPVGIITETDVFRMLVDEWDFFTGQRIDPGLVASLIAKEVNP